MFCNYCGSENTDDAKFCNSCGKNINLEPISPSPKIEKPILNHDQPIQQNAFKQENLERSFFDKIMTKFTMRNISIVFGVWLIIFIFGSKDSLPPSDDDFIEIFDSACYQHENENIESLLDSIGIIQSWKSLAIQNDRKENIKSQNQYTVATSDQPSLVVGKEADSKCFVTLNTKSNDITGLVKYLQNKYDLEQPETVDSSKSGSFYTFNGGKVILMPQFKHGILTLVYMPDLDNSNLIAVFDKYCVSYEKNPLRAEAVLDKSPMLSQPGSLTKIYLVGDFVITLSSRSCNIKQNKPPSNTFVKLDLDALKGIISKSYNVSTPRIGAQGSGFDGTTLFDMKSGKSIIFISDLSLGLQAKQLPSQQEATTPSLGTIPSPIVNETKTYDNGLSLKLTAGSRKIVGLYFDGGEDKDYWLGCDYPIKEKVEIKSVTLEGRYRITEFEGSSKEWDNKKYYLNLSTLPNSDMWLPTTLIKKGTIVNVISRGCGSGYFPTIQSVEAL